MRVAISAYRDFNDQLFAQQVMLGFKRHHPDAVLIVGANKADKMVGNVWRALNGKIITVEPEWNRIKNRKDAMKERDRRVLAHSLDLCLSFEKRGVKGYMAIACAKHRVPVESHDTAYVVVDAD